MKRGFSVFQSFSFLVLTYALMLLCSYALLYAEVLLEDDFTLTILNKNKWEIVEKPAPQVKMELKDGILQFSGSIEGQSGLNSNYVIISKEKHIKYPYKYEVEIKISFSGIPAKRLSEEEEYRIAASGRLERESRLGGGSLYPAVALRPPAVYFGIGNPKEATSFRFRIEPNEVYIMASTKGNVKTRGQIFEKVKDITEGRWYTYKIVYDSQFQTAYFYINEEILFLLKEIGLKEGFVFFGVTGEEGVGLKTINFARFDDVKIVKE